MYKRLEPRGNAVADDIGDGLGDRIALGHPDDDHLGSHLEFAELGVDQAERLRNGARSPQCGALHGIVRIHEHRRVERERGSIGGRRRADQPYHRHVGPDGRPRFVVDAGNRYAKGRVAHERVSSKWKTPRDGGA